jgi:hypothetical protein
MHTKHQIAMSTLVAQVDENLCYSPLLSSSYRHCGTSSSSAKGTLAYSKSNQKSNFIQKLKTQSLLQESQRAQSTPITTLPFVEGQVQEDEAVETTPCTVADELHNNTDCHPLCNEPPTSSAFDKKQNSFMTF